MSVNSIKPKENYSAKSLKTNSKMCTICRVCQSFSSYKLSISAKIFHIPFHIEHNLKSVQCIFTSTLVLRLEFAKQLFE